MIVQQKVFHGYFTTAQADIGLDFIFAVSTFEAYSEVFKPEIVASISALERNFIFKVSDDRAGTDNIMALVMMNNFSAVAGLGEVKQMSNAFNFTFTGVDILLFHAQKYVCVRYETIN